MPRYAVFAEADQPIHEPLTPELERQRHREALERLRKGLAEIPGITTQTIQEDTASAAIVTETDVSSLLRQPGLHFIPYEERPHALDTRKLFFVRYAPGSDRHANPTIAKVIQEEFGGTPGTEPHTYLIPTEIAPETRWLANPTARRNAEREGWMRTLKTIALRLPGTEIGIVLRSGTPIL